MGSQNLTPSAEDFTLDQPEPKLETIDEKKIAKASKSSEWKEIREYIEARKEIYSRYLPGVNPAINPADQTNANWRVADSIIREFDALIQSIEVIAGGLSR